MAQRNVSEELKGEPLPEDIIYSIILLLPPKAAFRCTLLSKHWYSLIQSPKFVDSHFQRSIARGSPTPFLVLRVPSELPTLETSTVLHDAGPSFSKVYECKMPTEFEPKTCMVHGSCNGLVVLTDHEQEKSGRVVYIWNPITGKFITVSDTSCSSELLYMEDTKVFLGFWYDDVSKDHKLVRLVYIFDGYEDFEEFQAEVYSLSTRTWRRIEDPDVPGIVDSPSPGMFFNGSLYWRAAYDDLNVSQFILSFDTRSEIFTEVAYPNGLLEEYADYLLPTSVVVYQGCLAFLTTLPYTVLDGSRAWTFWVRRKLGTEEMWVKERHEDSCPHKLLWCIGSTRNDELMFLTANCEIVAYSVGKNVYKQVGLVRSKLRADSFVDFQESLALLHEKNGSLYENETSSHSLPDEEPSTSSDWAKSMS